MEWFFRIGMLTLGFMFGVMMGSCTLSVTCVHSQGTASDLVDETQSASPDVKADPSLVIPASL